MYADPKVVIVNQVSKSSPPNDRRCLGRRDKKSIVDDLLPCLDRVKSHLLSYGVL